MAAKSAISGEYIIQREESGSIVVYRIFDNVKASLREISELKGFQYDPEWNVRQFGRKLCKEYGDGKLAFVGDYVIRVLDSGSIETYRTYSVQKEALREIAGKVGFEYDPEWTTQQLGSKLIDFIGETQSLASTTCNTTAKEPVKKVAETAEKTKVEAEKARLEAEKAKEEKAKEEAAKAKAEAKKAKAAAEAAQAEAENATAAPASTAAPANKGNKGALPGLFSVAANKKVRFSMGNLQFNPKKYEFRFALHQWDAIGADNSKIATNYDGWIDLFGYGTSGYMGVEPTETGTGSQYPGVDIANTNNDWGVYNPITNGGNKEGLWRTLTSDEWEYLFKNRPNAAKLRAKANVNGVNGAIILPDDFFEHRVRVPFDSTPDNFSGNTYDAVQWATLEAVGAIFLPCGGYRKGTSIMESTTYWYYWTSTGYGTYSSVSAARFATMFDSDYYQSYKGYCVRLVQDVK